VATTRIQTIDAHVAGQALRLIVNGLPPLRGDTLAEKQRTGRRLDRIRQALMREPRGHRDMLGALLTEPVSAEAQAGVLFMHHEGWRPVSLHGLMAVATIAIERGLITMPDDVRTLTFDTASGTFTVRVHPGQPIAVRGVPSFVLQAGADVKLPTRSLKVDIAFGGAFYAIVDGESAALPLVRDRYADLRALTRQIVASAERQYTIVHPRHADIAGLDGVIFTGPAGDETADLRSLTVYADGAVDRSPGGAATAAVMAIVDAMLRQSMDEDRSFTQEGPLGTRFRARVIDRVDVAGFPAIVPEIAGDAWITGEHVFLLDPDDPFADGFDL
jgi:proline racemase